jgi:hypothetical protein
MEESQLVISALPELMSEPLDPFSLISMLKFRTTVLVSSLDEIIVLTMLCLKMSELSESDRSKLQLFQEHLLSLRTTLTFNL